MEKDQHPDHFQLTQLRLQLHGKQYLDDEIEEALEIVTLFLLMFPEHPLTTSQSEILKEAMQLLREKQIEIIDSV